MTAFAINSGGVEYYDQKTGGSVNATLDTYTVSNGSTLVVRTDTYACPNHSSAFGSLDNVAFSGIGGEVIIDSTYVRYVAYTGGSGNSPAFGAAISQGGVSGVFLGVWANWQSEPIAPGAAIPASGFIKIGGVTGGAFSAAALTGIAATCSGADLQCWQEVRCAETATINVPRVGKFTGVEAWFYLDDTTGVAGQVIPCPTTGTAAQVWPGVWIETSPGSNEYEKFIGAAAQVAISTTPTDDRAKFVWQTTAGLVLGFNGTHTVGYVPPAGCRVRIPAAILTNCARTAGGGSGPRVVPNAALATRAEFVTTAGGYLDLQGLVVFWYANLTQAYFVNIVSCAFTARLIISEVASFVTVADICVSAVQAQSSEAFTYSYNTGGGLISDVSCARHLMGTSGDGIFVVANSRDLTIENSVARLLAARTINSCSGFKVGSSNNIKIVGCLSICARFSSDISNGVEFEQCSYVDGYVNTTSSVATNAVYMSSTNDSKVVDLRFPYVNAPSYGTAIYLLVCSGIKIYSIGTFDSPLDFVNLCQYLVDLNTGTTNVDVKRCYVVNTRSGLYIADNSVDGCVFENVAGDYADASITNTSNTIEKSVGYTSVDTGQSAIYGTHWKSRFASLTVGVLEILCNEPTVQSSAQCVITSGAPKFNSVGSVLMTLAGQQIIWEMPFFALGHTELANSALTLAGGNTGNLSYEFQYDLGAGYNGTWLTANAANFTGVGAIDPAVGIKIKLRVTCVTANAGNSLRNIRITTVTTAAAQSENLYPLDTITLTFTGLITGSDVVVRAAGTSTILASVDSNAGTTWAYVYETPVAIDVDVIKPGYVPKSLLRNYTPSAQNSSLPVSQLLDRNYL